jgi:hypothetical protein
LELADAAGAGDADLGTRHVGNVKYGDVRVP